MKIKKRDKIWKIGFVFFLIVLIFSCFIIYSMREKQSQKNKVVPKSEYEKVHLFQRISKGALWNEDGEEITILDKNEISVFLFWASWCPHCVDEISKADSLAQIAEEEGAKFYLVDKLDYEKETKEQAWNMLKDKRVNTKTYFDEECKFYKTVGLNSIPTLIVVDSENQIISMTEGSIPSKNQLQNMIIETKIGKSKFLSEKIIDNLMNEESGIRTNYTSKSVAIPSGEDVLSESQGIMMEYAALSGNKELFSKLWNYTKNRQFPEGVMPWVISEKSQTNVNALIDDLRIIGALQREDNWMNRNEKGYKAYLDSIYTWNTKDGKFVDFYDVSSKQKADRFTLCYGDLAVLSGIKKTDRRFQKLYGSTLEIIKKGVISEKFPLYYSYYDYTQGKYKGETLNMAEEMTTLLHLAEVGELPEEALDWISKELEKGCVYGAYDLEGSPAENGYFESTSVYALIVMTALLAGREDIAGKAINKMEQFRIADSENRLNGLFGNSDGTGIYSFDQGMALLAYELYERMIP